MDAQMIGNTLKKKILDTEKLARRLEPSTEQRANWSQQATQYAEDFLDHIEKNKTFEIDKGTGQGLFSQTFGEAAKPMADLLETIRQEVDYPGLNPASGGHMAYIPGGGVIPTAWGDYLAAITNRYAGIFYASPGAVRMENHLIRWMCQLMGYPDSALGNLTSGGSIANLIAIATARDAKSIRARDIEHSVIYLTQQIHHSIQKALRIAGLNEAIIRYIPVDTRFRMDTQALKAQLAKDSANGLRPFLLVASAGTTDTGAIDPLDELADIAEDQGMWFHVDAAYGGFFILCEEIRKEYSGIHRSDSITIDPHKGLFLAYGSGAVLIKDVQSLQDTHYYKGNYMQDSLSAIEEPSPADLSPELTKHFRGLRMWLPLQLYGLAPFRAALQEKLYLCRYFYQKIQELGFEVGPEPELSVTIYRYIPKIGSANHFNAQLVEAVKEDGQLFISSTKIEGVFWLRLAVLCFRTHLYHVDLLLKVLEESVARLSKTAAYLER
ncbi:MAG: aminotransferase class V-fold PLP-dependent enzyme [Bacteroidota bacterium]